MKEGYDSIKQKIASGFKCDCSLFSVMTFPGSVPLASLLLSPGFLLTMALPDPFHLTNNNSVLKSDSDVKSGS